MKRNAFTLIELLVAISIIAVISTIGLNSYVGISGRTRDSVRKNDLTHLALALELYIQKNNKYIEGVTSCQTDPNPTHNTFYNAIKAYMRDQTDLPVDPSTKQAYCYISEDGLTYKLYAKLEDNSDYILSSEDYIAQAQPQTQPQVAAPPPAPPPAPINNNPPATLPTLRVFVSKTTYTGNLGGVNGADIKCQQAADAIPALQGKLWRAWISTGSVNAKDRIADGKYVRMDGAVIAQSRIDLLDGSIAAAINLTEESTAPSVYGSEHAAYTWTGTNASGNATTSTCAGWDQPQFANATIGVTTATSGWSDGGYGAEQCQTYQRHLYCFEQPAPSNPSQQDFDNDGYVAQTDCDDQNANAHPGQTRYFTTAASNGSFDYDCSGSIQPQYPYWGLSCGTYQVTTASFNTCFPSWACGAVGTATAASDCGKIGNFLTDQNPDLYQCDEAGSFPVHSPEKVTLACR